MKFSEQWLREWVNPNISPAELAEQLTLAGLEVNAIEPAAPSFQGIVVGAVLAVERHPEADRLHVCRVDVGTEATLNIVCGAPNVHVGMRAPTALIGAQLPGGIILQRTSLRGVESEGMLCSAKELGLAEDTAGLMNLPSDAPLGTDLRDYLQLNDVIIDVDLTPNRGDCLSLAGLAREVSTLNRLQVQAPLIEPVPADLPDTFPVQVETPADCPRYVGRVIRDIDPTAVTPLGMQERLRRGGVRPIHPVVDVTHYVMLELGQPMHAFDLEKLVGCIRIRHATPGEQLLTLDGQQIDLQRETLVIADEKGPLAMAGIIGGTRSGVSQSTQHLFLESAYFTPQIIAGRSRRYGLQTESAHRFERGVAPDLQVKAVERATALLLDIVGGQSGPVIEVSDPSVLPTRPSIRLRQRRIEQVLGASISPQEVEDILMRLGLQIDPIAEGWYVVPPSFRFDIVLEIDLIEELARVYGYTHLPSERPRISMQIAPQEEQWVSPTRLRQVLVDRDYQEAITYSFVDPRLQGLLNPEEESISLANPISTDMSVMRTSLWSGLIQAYLNNLKRQQTRIRLFEIGLRFIRRDGEIIQTEGLAGLIAGSLYPEQWGIPSRTVDFFDVKGDVETLLDLTGHAVEFVFAPARRAALHPGQAAAIKQGGETVGWIGSVHPALQKALDLGQRVCLFELDLAAVLSAQIPQFAEFSRFPSVRRDLAVVVDKSVPARQVIELVKNAAQNLLQELSLFDVYAGQAIESGRKSLALGLTLQHPSRTLTDQESEEIVSQVVARLSDELNAVLR